MRTALKVIVCFVVLLAYAVPLTSQDKEAKLTGKVTCAKCGLKKDTACATVIVAKEGGKDVVYYLDEKSGKANHEAICQGEKDGTVTGIVSEKAGRKIVTASKVELKK